jgi:hypothetical protein
MDDDQINEAAVAVLQTSGVTSYLYSIGYDLDQWMQELGAAVEHIKSQSG